MKKITNYFIKRDILFKDFKEVLPKELNSRKNIQIFVGSSIDLKFYAIFIINSKSRFLQKNADELIKLSNSLATYVGHNFKKKELLINSPLCSKAKKYLKELGWSVRVDF